MTNKFGIDFDSQKHKIGSGLVTVPLTVLASKIGSIVYRKIVEKIVEKKLSK